MMIKKCIRAIYLTTVLSVSPAVAESLNLQIESGAITGITDMQTGQLVLYISEKSSHALNVFTQRHVGREVEILVDDETLARPTIRSPIYGPAIPITQPMTDAKRRAIITKLVEGTATLRLQTIER